MLDGAWKVSDGLGKLMYVPEKILDGLWKVLDDVLGPPTRRV